MSRGDAVRGCRIDRDVAPDAATRPLVQSDESGAWRWPMMARLLEALSLMACLLLAVFFAFVGYWKALGPIDALAEHHAWVAGWPDWFARSVGWSELACGAALVASTVPGFRGLAYWTAIVLIVNQLAALAVHASRGEVTAAGPQNLIILVMLGLIALQARRAHDRYPNDCQRRER
jgi:DoxX-like family